MAKTRPSQQPRPAAAASGVAAVLAVCCGTHAIALGALAGVGLSAVFGIAGAVFAAVVVVVLALAVRRRRAEACRSTGRSGRVVSGDEMGRRTA